MRDLSLFIFTLKRGTWNVNSGSWLTRLKLKKFAFKMTPASTREIKKIIYQHFDLIVDTWNKYFKKS